VVLLSGLAPATASGAAAAAPPARVLPDLVPQSPEKVIGPTTEFSLGLGVDAPLLVNGCYAEERIRKGAERCLRFDTIVGNVGAGAFELAYQFEKARGVSAVQRVFRSDGSYSDRFAVRSELHATHGHFHVQDFYVSRLWEAGPGGERVGDAPVARGDKNGFCPEDSSPVEGGPDDGRRHYSCFTPDEPDQRGFQVVGISAGWRDVYGASLPDQFVEITGVPDGRYVLEIELDPHDVFVEGDELNNTICVLVSLAGFSAKVVTANVRC
jgi:hypothetical protein